MKLTEALSNDSTIMRDIETKVDDKGIYTTKETFTGDKLTELLKG